MSAPAFGLLSIFMRSEPHGVLAPNTANVEHYPFTMWSTPRIAAEPQVRCGGEDPTKASWRVSARHVGQLCLGAPIRCRFWLCARFRGLVGGAFGVAGGGSRAGHRFPGAAMPAGVVRWLWGCR